MMKPRFRAGWSLYMSHFSYIFHQFLFILLFYPSIRQTKPSSLENSFNLFITKKLKFLKFQCFLTNLIFKFVAIVAYFSANVTETSKIEGDWELRLFFGKIFLLTLLTCLKTVGGCFFKKPEFRLTMVSSIAFT